MTLTPIKHNPGSSAAVKVGCTCPVIDNHHGEGFPINGGANTSWWVTAGCPLHDAGRTLAMADISNPTR